MRSPSIGGYFMGGYFKKLSEFILEEDKRSSYKRSSYHRLFVGGCLLGCQRAIPCEFVLLKVVL